MQDNEGENRFPIHLLVAVRKHVRASANKSNTWILQIGSVHNLCWSVGEHPYQEGFIQIESGSLLTHIIPLAHPVKSKLNQNLDWILGTVEFPGIGLKESCSRYHLWNKDKRKIPLVLLSTC